MLVGGPTSNCSDPSWNQTYRAVQHGHTKAQCRELENARKFPEPIEDFGSQFVDMQRKRHVSDYGPFDRRHKSELEQDIAISK